MRGYLRRALFLHQSSTDAEEKQMFPSHELVVAAEAAYRREQLIAIRPPHRTRRAHRPRRTIRHPLTRVVAGPAGGIPHAA